MLTSYWYLFLCNHRKVEANIVMTVKNLYSGMKWVCQSSEVLTEVVPNKRAGEDDFDEVKTFISD